MSDLTELYQELILDHAKRPHHFGGLANASHTARGINPICGDELFLSLNVESNKVSEVKFNGDGCALSMASASIMTDLIEGKSYTEIEQVFSDFHAMLTEKQDPATLPIELQAFSSVNQFPMRIKCVTLAWHTLKAALGDKDYPVSTEDNE